MKNKDISVSIGIIALIIIAIVIVINFGEPKEIQEYTTTSTTTSETTTMTTTTTTTQTSIRTTKKTTRRANTTGTYKLTHYGPDCKGCSGITASGYNVKNTIWYEDSEYGKVRVIATSNQFKMYSIIKIKDYKLGGDLTCIVLDRGVGNGVIDLLVSSESVASQLGIQRINIEVLRNGK